MIRLLISTMLLLVIPAITHAKEIRFGTWNIADLYHEENVPLRSGSQPRDAEDFNRLRDFAASLKLDIIALQEIGSPRALAKIFPSNEYDIIMSDRYQDGDENKSDSERDIFTAFAVRRSTVGNSFTTESLKALGILHVGFDRDGTASTRPTRAGLILNLTVDGRQIKFLNVHLKSSCHGNSLRPVFDTKRDGKPDISRFACRTAVAQAMILENWIEQQNEEGHSVIVLGDFNRRFNRFDDDPGKTDHYWQFINDGTPNRLELRKGPSGRNTTCWKPGHKLFYEQHIDFIVFDNTLDRMIAVDSISKTGLPFPEDPKYAGLAGKKLSDHCPVIATLDTVEQKAPKKVEPPAPKEKKTFEPSRALQYQMNSAEYRVLTATTFKRAADRVATIAANQIGSKIPWVVAIDADETLLSNAQFHLETEMAGGKFDPNRWDDWVSRVDATPVPGALGFISRVLTLGGKVAVITNRKAELATATLDNLRKLGIHADRSNLCVLGKPTNVTIPPFGNDKDIRRQAVKNGTARECWQGASIEAQTSWERRHKIVIHVGDNIEDFPGIRQSVAASHPELVIERLGREWFLLPNAVYGSWQK